MSRDQRMLDNWALLHAIEQAGKTGAPVAVVFNLVTLLSSSPLENLFPYGTALSSNACSFALGNLPAKEVLADQGPVCWPQLCEAYISTI